jgi:hypothetical protein
MPITPYLDDFNVDPETRRVLGVALEMTRVSLGLADHHANGIIAQPIIELAKAGERNPDLLCEGALKKFTRSLVRRLATGMSRRPGDEIGRSHVLALPFPTNGSTTACCG